MRGPLYQVITLRARTTHHEPIASKWVVVRLVLDELGHVSSPAVAASKSNAQPLLCPCQRAMLSAKGRDFRRHYPGKAERPQDWLFAANRAMCVSWGGKSPAHRRSTHGL